MYSLICAYNVLVNIWTNGTGYPPFNPGSEGYDGFDFTLSSSPPPQSIPWKFFHRQSSMQKYTIMTLTQVRYLVTTLNINVYVYFTQRYLLFTL